VALGVGVRETVAVAGRAVEVGGLTVADETIAGPSTLLRGVKVASATAGGVGLAGAPQAERIETIRITNKSSFFIFLHLKSECHR
jgi:hypothetical protein